MRTKKILFVLASLVWMAFLAVSFITGDATAATVLAIPLAVPVIKSAAIGDSDALATELNRVFATLSESIKSAIEEEYRTKGAASIEDIDKKLEKLGIKAETIKEISEAVKEHGLALENKSIGDVAKMTIKSMIQSAFKREGLADEIKSFYESRHGSIEVTKAVGTITTGNVATTTGGNALLDMLNADEINDIRLTMPFIEDFSNTGSTNKPVYTYVDYVPGEGDVDFIAEGGEKAQLDLNIEVRTASPVKAAGYEILTEESITDIPRLESTARGYLFRKYLLKRQNGILFGDGLQQNPLGVTKIAAAFNPATWVAEKIVKPNLHDAVIAVANQIYTTPSYTDDVEFYPNVCFINPGDFAGLRLTKDNNGQYLFPSFTLFGEKTIDGIRIVAKSKIPAGKILMGDFMKLNIIDYVAYSVRIGWINDQFIKNLFTMLGEGRFYVYVKELEKRAFVYDDIANVIAGIEKVQA